MTKRRSSMLRLIFDESSVLVSIKITIHNTNHSKLYNLNVKSHFHILCRFILLESRVYKLCLRTRKMDSVFNFVNVSFFSFLLLLASLLLVYSTNSIFNSLLVCVKLSPLIIFEIVPHNKLVTVLTFDTLIKCLFLKEYLRTSVVRIFLLVNVFGSYFQFFKHAYFNHLNIVN